MNYYVESIPQETNNTCWAAAMAMLLQYLSGNSRPPASRPSSPFVTAFTPRYVAEQVGGVVLWAYNRDRLLSTDFRSNFTQLATPWRLTAEFQFTNPEPSEWDRLLRTFGPFFVIINIDGLIDHAVIVSGIDQDHLTIVDPWPVRSGRRYRKSRERIHLTGTVIHAGPNTLVLQPVRGGGA